MADRPDMFGTTRGFSGMADSMEHAKCCGPTVVAMATTDIWARRGDPVQSPTACEFFFSSFAVVTVESG